MSKMQLFMQCLTAVILVGIMYFVSDFFWFSAWGAESEALEKQVAKLKQKNDATDLARPNQKELEERYAAAVRRNEELKVWLVSPAEWAQIFSDIKTEARQSSVTFESFNDTHQQFKLGLNESSITIRGRGTYLNNLNFLHRLAIYSKAIVWRDGTIVRDENQDGILDLTGFFLIDLPTQEALDQMRSK